MIPVPASFGKDLQTGEGVSCVASYDEVLVLRQALVELEGCTSPCGDVLIHPHADRDDLHFDVGCWQAFLLTVQPDDPSRLPLRLLLDSCGLCASRQAFLRECCAVLGVDMNGKTKTRVPLSWKPSGWSLSKDR